MVLKSWKAKKIDLSGILHPVTIDQRHQRFITASKQDHGMDDIIDWKLLKNAKAAFRR
jgi:glutamate synthase (NADPH/NADH) large chain